MTRIIVRAAGWSTRPGPPKTRGFSRLKWPSNWRFPIWASRYNAELLHPACGILACFRDCGRSEVKIRSRFLTQLFAVVAVGLVRLLFKTCRVRAVPEDPGSNCYGSTGDRRYLYCIWHDQIMMTVFTGRPQKMAGLVSAHQDGSYLAESMKLLGITPVRGSSKRGGSRAMRELLERVREYHVAITPDGPRGPRHKIKTGIIFLASRSGRGIIPTAYGCRRAWYIRGNWTDMMIPWPFTVIYARGGPPFFVPPGIERDELEEYARRLEAEMERLEALVAKAIRGEDVDLPATAGKTAAERGRAVDVRRAA